MKNYFPQKKCLLSDLVAFRAKSEVITSPAENRYKIGFISIENRIAIKTGNSSANCVISVTTVSGSTNISSSSLIDLIPWLCNWVIERFEEWSKAKFKSISFQMIDSALNQDRIRTDNYSIDRFILPFELLIYSTLFLVETAQIKFES